MCEHCGATDAEMDLYANGVYCCSDPVACIARRDVRYASENVAASVVSSEEGGRGEHGQQRIEDVFPLGAIVKYSEWGLDTLGGAHNRGRRREWRGAVVGYSRDETCIRCRTLTSKTVATFAAPFLEIADDTPPASVIGDASEGEAVPFDRHAIIAACASASFPDDLANQILSLLGCYDARTASLRSTRAALEEARAAIRAHLAECVPCENEHCGDADCASRRALRAAIPSQESTKV